MVEFDKRCARQLTAVAHAVLVTALVGFAAGCSNDDSSSDPEPIAPLVTIPADDSSDDSNDDSVPETTAAETTTTVATEREPIETIPPDELDTNLTLYSGETDGSYVLEIVNTGQAADVYMFATDPEGFVSPDTVYLDPGETFDVFVETDEPTVIHVTSAGLATRIADIPTSDATSR